MFVFILLPAVPLIIICLLAFSKKSDNLIKKIAKVALIIIVISIVVCVLVLLNANYGASSGSALPIDNMVPVTKNSEVKFLVFFAAFLVGFFVLLLFLQSREKKTKKRPKRAKETW